MVGRRALIFRWDGKVGHMISLVLSLPCASHWEYRQIGRPAFSEFTGKLVKKYLKLYSARIKSVWKRQR